MPTLRRLQDIVLQVVVCGERSSALGWEDEGVGSRRPILHARSGGRLLSRVETDGLVPAATLDSRNPLRRVIRG